MKCPKCKNEMVKGFVKSPNGSPEEVWGTKSNLLGGVEDRKEVETYRCEKCGYLESYAK